MDLTPWVGIIGAAIGGSIGLIGQRMSIREQRRRDPYVSGWDGTTGS